MDWTLGEFPERISWAKAADTTLVSSMEWIEESTSRREKGQVEKS